MTTANIRRIIDCNKKSVLVIQNYVYKPSLRNAPPSPFFHAEDSPHALGGGIQFWTNTTSQIDVPHYQTMSSDNSVATVAILTDHQEHSVDNPKRETNH